jgi:hypothetical protein
MNSFLREHKESIAQEYKTIFARHEAIVKLRARISIDVNTDQENMYSSEWVLIIRELPNQAIDKIRRENGTDNDFNIWRINY